VRPPFPNVYLICVVRPPGYRHASAFQEIAETLCFGLQRLGCIAAIQENRFAADATNIILGANLIAEKLIDMIPANSILYNLEQIEPTSTWFEPAFQQLLREFAVWDYSARNIERIRQLGDATQIRHVPIGYVPEMSRITAAASQDIDVLFYGSANTRRGKILHALRATGLNLHTAFDVYGAERDALIARSKVVLNMHYYDSSIFEIVRVSYLLANRKAVVTECHAGTEIDADMQDAVVPARYDRLVDACVDLVGNVRLREALEQRGFARIRARDETVILRTALSI
jgi:hypothetical protein